MSIPTMRALQQTSLNGPQDLRLVADVPVPVPGPGEVLIRVAAAGVNFGDIAQAYGTLLGGPRPPPPRRASTRQYGHWAPTTSSIPAPPVSPPRCCG